jgi:hypothetical protein
MIWFVVGIDWDEKFEYPVTVYWFEAYFVGSGVLVQDGAAGRGFDLQPLEYLQDNGQRGFTFFQDRAVAEAFFDEYAGKAK